MRPFRAREAAAKADGLRLRRGDEPFSRWHGGAGEARRLFPLAGSAGVRPVPGRGEVRRRPQASKPPFVVGSNCAIFGTPCGGGHPSYRFVAPLHTVAALRFPAPSGPPIAPLPRNRLAFSAAGGASPLSSSPQNPLRWAFVGAPIGCVEKRMRFLMVLREKGSGGGIPDFVRNARGACYGGLARWWPVVWTTQPHMSMKKLGAFPDAPPFSFRCRTLAVGDSWAPSY